MRDIKLLKSILCSLLFFSLSLSLLGCVSNKVNNDPNDSDTDIKTSIETEVPNHIKYDKVKDYQIIEDDSGYRMVFNDISVYDPTGHPGPLKINSFEDFSDRLLKGELTFNEKQNLCSFITKDDNGLNILNPNYSYRILHSLPHQVNYEEIQYLGKGISLEFDCEKHPTPYHITITILEPLQYHNEYGIAFENYTKDESKIEYEMKLINDEIVTCYNKIVETKNNKIQERYVLSNGTKDVFIKKIYYEDSITPNEIYLCYSINDAIYFNIFSSNISFFSGEIPNDEFWFGFDVEAIERT